MNARDRRSLRQTEAIDEGGRQREKERIEREQNIYCPHCNKKQSMETRAKYINLWGLSVEALCSCDFCHKEFWVKEIVTREYKTKIRIYEKE